MKKWFAIAVLISQLATALPLPAQAYVPAVRPNSSLSVWRRALPPAFFIWFLAMPALVNPPSILQPHADTSHLVGSPTDSTSILKTMFRNIDSGIVMPLASRYATVPFSDSVATLFRRYQKVILFENFDSRGAGTHLDTLFQNYALQYARENPAKIAFVSSSSRTIGDMSVGNNPRIVVLQDNEFLEHSDIDFEISNDEFVRELNRLVQ